MNGKLLPSEQTWQHHRAGLTCASWTTLTGTNRWLKHNGLIQISMVYKMKSLQLVVYVILKYFSRVNFLSTNF